LIFRKTMFGNDAKRLAAYLESDCPRGNEDTATVTAKVTLKARSVEGHQIVALELDLP